MALEIQNNTGISMLMLSICKTDVVSFSLGLGYVRSLHLPPKNALITCLVTSQHNAATTALTNRTDDYHIAFQCLHQCFHQ